MTRFFVRTATYLVFSSLLVAACGGDQEGGIDAGSGGAGLGQTGGTGSDSGGISSGGNLGAAAGGGSGAAPSTGGTATSGAGGEMPVVDPPAGANWHGWVCPPGPFAALPFESTVAVEQVEGLPPDDEYVMAERSLVIVEGPVWIDGALYVSQIDGGAVGGGFPGNGTGGESGIGSGGTPGASSGGADSGGDGAGGDGSGGGFSMPSGDPPPARVIKMSEAGEISVLLPDGGSNGLAVDPQGALTLAVHKTGAVESMNWTDQSTTPLVGKYAAERFNSPNDLAFGPDGSLYFTDPDYQAPRPRPQEQTRVYRLAPGASEAEVLIEGRRQPNGVSISPGGRTLYVSGEDGIFSYPIADDGSIGEATPFAAGIASRSDGMGVDCAGNVYLTVGAELVVVSPAGQQLVRVSIPDVQSVTNVAFGGAERTTVYLTSLGTTPGSVAGVFRLSSALPGFPY